MNKNISRRAFLKGSIAAACTISASAVPCTAQKTGREKHLATLIDIRKCIGCGECVEACREANAEKYPVPKKPFPKMYPERSKPEDWSDKKEDRDQLTPYNWLFIQTLYLNINGEESSLTIPRRCMHCVNPPCVKLCPWGAAKQFENGISQIDDSLCFGGSKCKNVCPWKIPQRQSGVGLYLDVMPSLAGNGVMYKCDRCYTRLAKGENPACIDACPEEVQTIGPRDEIIKQAHALAKEINGYIYGEKENGGTNTIYVSPVPFEELNKAAAKGEPHLKTVHDTMSDANKLASAMIIAPFAGAAAAFGKYYKSAKNS
ncbi:Putative 4Fe-4S ferredoxin iron-sulfur binding domain protein, OhcB-like [Desulfonema limicola]|uniref:4Fe-4S ferredoxin iron-sulfur binding domain protein, OhcB-like n=1 Tax=Desulfonema limicola TaxID=45656 RepID=A0A975GEK0_9BACT|nr:4Fe-4S dicluster domain-containing protein [Desulfonema limicola]QTA78283.1 Putative 4Fe-4S ferredoxin iron-sulfur binding domain protein, OhcB-like [Desulfonema limicola]